MKNDLGKGRYGCWIAALLAVFLLLQLPAWAEKAPPSAPSIIRVAFPEVEGLSETAEDGTHCGLVVDYLNEIAKYTGWEYEYVDTTGEKMFEEFLAGEYDLMGGTYYQSALEQYIAYPEYNMGYSKSILLCRKDNQDILTYDLKSLNGKTIGVYAPAEENIRRLQDFLQLNRLDCTIKAYSKQEMAVDGNLYPYLRNGEVDLLLGNIADWNEEFQVVATYDAQPYYLVTTVGNQEVLEGLNMALGKILDAEPTFDEIHYAIHFSDKLLANVQLNEGERAYIQQKETVTVAIPKQWHPLSCPNMNSDFHRGLVVDILNQVSAFSGLQFTYQYTNSYQEALQLVQQGQADLLGFYLDSEQEAVKQKLALSTPYAQMTNIVVRNKNVSYPDQGLVGAVLEGQHLPSDIAAEVKVYSDADAALMAVEKGRVDFIYGLSAHLEQAFQQHYFSNLVPVTLSDNVGVSFALNHPADSNLLSILNKAIHHLSDEEKAEILSRNTVAIGLNNKVSLKNLVYGNPVEFICIVGFFLLVLMIAVLWAGHMRMQATIIQNNLEKAEAQNKAKDDFLSRVSHEIRTPMNAIVGLADLTAMMENVPPEAKENLTNIRSSSHYLLDLINDILDMSRIENAMLLIEQEPFMLSRVVEGIQNMMSFEAKRRGLTYEVEQNIVHDNLLGDGIRLRQVLTNLVSNALKFTPAGGKVILQVIEHFDDQEEENMASFTFRVIDNGRGISLENQQRIFEAFEQAGPTHAKVQGTGLGLPISRSIVEQMGGQLCVSSQPGQGSEFYFVLALPLDQNKLASKQEKSRPLATSKNFEGVKILLVEDNDLNAKIAIKLLEIQGAIVYWVENGKLAVERFASSRPGEIQLILMDIQMPEMNGIEATEAIRALAHPDGNSIPIVAMTANSWQADIDAAMAAGMDGFIAKPLDVNRFYQLLHQLLKHEIQG